MADQLRMTIYKNMVKKSGIGSSSTSGGSSNLHLNSREEQMLLEVMHKNGVKSTLNTTSNTTSVPVKNNLSSLNSIINSMQKPTTSSAYNQNSGSKLMQKISLDSFVKKSPKAEEFKKVEVKKNTTAMTLDELVARCQKTSNVETNTNTQPKNQGINVSVKSGVIGNASSIESLIPKISLNSIGKNNSFLK
jgi:hypothetical protein